MAARGGPTLDEMLRFRLKKTVPFDVREACIATLLPRGGARGSSWWPPSTGRFWRATSTPCRELGFEPGQVEIAGLALAEHAALPLGDSALVNWDHGYVSIVILRDGWPILVRTLVGDFTGTAEPVVRGGRQHDPLLS